MRTVCALKKEDGKGRNPAGCGIWKRRKSCGESRKFKEGTAEAVKKKEGRVLKGLVGRKSGWWKGRGPGGKKEE